MEKVDGWKYVRVRGVRENEEFWNGKQERGEGLRGIKSLNKN